MLPCENSIHGQIARNFDLLFGHDTLSITGETTHRIVQNLIGTPDADIEAITAVRSHPVALDQCRTFLHTMPHLSVEPVLDTAGAVREIVANGDAHVAAIASAASARLYGGRVLARAIQDDHENVTRFFLIRPSGESPHSGDRACIAFTLAHTSGSLHEALGTIAEDGANLRSLCHAPAGRAPVRVPLLRRDRRQLRSI